MSQPIKKVSTSKQTERQKNPNNLHMPISQEDFFNIFLKMFLHMNQLKIQNEENCVHYNLISANPRNFALNIRPDMMVSQRFWIGSEVSMHH